jgi:Na+/H+ antiporter NhaA
MTLFFLVVGLEARREFDLGDLRERRRFVLPLVAGVVGMAVPIGIFLLFNAGLPSAHGWGVAMSTDTALALGLLAILGRHVPDKVRLFVLTIFVVDDLAALLVIAVVYSEPIETLPLALAVAVFALLLLVVARSMRRRSVYVVIGLTLWLALEASGVDPVVAGLVIGLSAPAYTPSRDALEQATGRVRQFREQPTPELVREATTSLSATLSPNARLQSFYHPWTSFVIVPLFALANAGVVLSGDVLATAFTAPVTLGVFVGYVVGKPLGVVATAWAVTRISRGRIRPPVGWAATRRRSGRSRPSSCPRRSPGWCTGWSRCSRPRPRRGRWSATWPTSRTSCRRSTSTTTTSAARRAPRSR